MLLVESSDPWNIFLSFVLQVSFLVLQTLKNQLTICTISGVKLLYNFLNIFLNIGLSSFLYIISDCSMDLHVQLFNINYSS